MEPTEVAWIALTIGVLLGWLFAYLLRRQDLKTFLFARAPALPVRSLSVHDDAWLRGTVRCEEPLTCPWFAVPCVAFAYQIEEEKTEHYTDSNGKRQTRTTWKTVYSDRGAIDFELDDGARVIVALPEGQNEAVESTGTDYEFGSRRHSATVLPVGATVSAFGVLRDDHTFGPYRNVPLLVTFATRSERVRTAAAREGWLFALALLFPYLGLVAAAALWLDARDWRDLLGPAAIGLAILVPQWWLLTFNRLVRLRQQVRTAQKQVSIELLQRRELVPNLVAVVKAAAAHERELLERLSALRADQPIADQVRGEEAARRAAAAVLVLHERYPELKSDALYRDLHDRLCTIEEKIAHARGFYNDTITEWNDRVQQVPSSLVARSAGMRPEPLFAAGDEVELPPRLTLS